MSTKVQCLAATMKLKIVALAILMVVFLWISTNQIWGFNQQTLLEIHIYCIYIYIHVFIYIYIQHCENTLVANCDPWKQNGWSNLLTFADYPGNYLNMRASVSVFTGFLQTFNQKPVSQNISLDSTEKHRPWVSLSPCFIQYSSIFNIQYSSIQYSIQQNLKLNTKATNFN